MFVTRHCPSKTLVVVKQTNVDVQNAEQLENLKVCTCFGICLKKCDVDWQDLSNITIYFLQTDI